MRIPLTSGAYTAASLIANAQECINLFPESNPQETNPPVPVTHYPRPGLTLLSSPAAPGKGRSLYTATNGDLYAVIDQQVFYIDPDWQRHQIGSLLTPATTPVIMADNGSNAIVVDGDTSGNNIDLASRTMVVIGDPNFLGGTRVDFLDSFLILNQPGTRNWYCSLANQIVFDALSIGVKTAWPDPIQTIIAVERAAWILGKYKSELWFNAGAVPFPFQIQPGLIIEHGCVAPYSAAKQDVNCYWLSQSPEGARMAMKGTQNLAQRISNHAIEAEWLTYARVDDAIGSCYQIQGHAFYCLDFPTADKTWVYDEATKQWHRETYLDVNGIPHRSLVPFKAYAYGVNVGLDRINGNLYKIDTNNFTDNGMPIQYLRSFPHIETDKSIAFTVWKFIADTEAGTPPGTTINPVAGSPWSLGFSPGFGPATLTEPPLISLRVSNTRGESWGNAVMQPMGAAGLYNTRPTWYQVGYGFDFVFELSWSTPMKTALNGAYIEIEEAEAQI